MACTGHENACLSRRDFLWRYGGGLGGVALAALLRREGELAHAAVPPQFAPRAKRVVQLFMSGAASQVDTFDYKPALIKRHGEKFDPGGTVELFQSDPGSVMKSPWAWKQHGECGKWISELVPHIASCADDIAFLHGMVSKSNVHGPATFLQSTGYVLPGFPSAGAWVSYGLGSENDALPAFVVLPDSRGFPPGGPKNWSNGFLPSAHQGTLVRASAPEPIYDLFPPKDSYATPDTDADALAVLEQLNRAHAAERPGDSRLDARIKSYELAARLQLSAPEVMNIATEPEHIRRLYGIDDEPTRDFGTNCLIARRMLERGVRFVQVWSGADNGFPRRNWDSHEDLARDHAIMAQSMDRPAAALIKDLKQRGMLDDTIVFWTTEFGRMPCSQGGAGRDHNPFGYTCWLAGGGIRGGTTHGATDEWSYKAVEDITYGYDVHATILHLLGIDHTRLSYRNNGVDRRLTDVHGHVISAIV